MGDIDPDREIVDKQASVSVETVTGAIAADTMGVTLTHEHIFVDASAWWDKDSTSGLAEAKVDITILGRLRHDPFSCKDNLVLDDEAVAQGELARFYAAGGRTILDPTCIGIGRNVLAQQRVSHASGVHIVAGSGYYTSFARPPEVADMSVAEITEIIVNEVTVGVDGTDIRCGFIGEIGITDGSREISHGDEKVLRGAARAQALTDVPLMVHLVDPLGHEVLDMIEAEGGNLCATILAHMPHTQDDLSYQMELAERGVRLAYDLFGIDWYFPGSEQYGSDLQSPSDEQMAGAVARLVEAGVEKQLLLSSDTFSKMQLVRYGGCGYAHVIENIVPRLRRLGVPEDIFEELLVVNARTLFEDAATRRK